MLNKLAQSALAGLIVLPMSLSAQGETRETTYPDGKPKERFEILAGDEGVRHGSFESWYANGKTSAEGKYEDGLKEGRWTYYHENGKKSAFGRYEKDERTGKWRFFHDNGEKRGNGDYADGHMEGEWTFWLHDGDTVDVENTGVYALERRTYPSGSLRGEGVTRDGVPHGSWRFFWENGVPQFQGELSNGRREGVWRFHHEDASYDPELLSGAYENDVRIAKGETAEDDAVRDGSYELPELDVPSWSSPEEQAEVERLLDRLAGTRGDDRKAVMAELLALRGACVPATLNRIRALDIEDEDDARLARDAYGAMLSRLCSDRGFEWRFTGAGQDTANNELTIQRWFSVWAVTSADPEFWEIDAAHLGSERGTAGLSPLFDVPYRTAAPSGAANAVYADRRAEAKDAEVAAAVQRGLAWLADQQLPDGSWDADAWPGDEAINGIQRMAYHDIGVTCLALLSFLADGSTTREGPYSRNIGSGLRWIATRLQQDGSLESPLPPDDLHFDQALVALVLAEASAFSDSRVLLGKTRIALKKIQSMRDDSGPWSTGRPNTIISAWMVHAVKAAEWAGLEVDPAGYTAAIAYIDEMTEPTQGRIGFNAPGSFPTRTAGNADFPRELSESPTAAGLFTRTLIGEMPKQERLLAKQIYRLRKLKPRWHPSGHPCDMHYWYFATLALAQLGGDSWEEWWEPMKKVAVAAQRKDGDAAGSWDPIGPWGYIGGRVYSTTMMTLSLQAPSRLKRLSEVEFENYAGSKARIQDASSYRTQQAKHKRQR